MNTPLCECGLEAVYLIGNSHTGEWQPMCEQCDDARVEEVYMRPWREERRRERELADARRRWPKWAALAEFLERAGGGSHAAR